MSDIELTELRGDEWDLIERAWAEFSESESARVVAIVGASLISQLLEWCLREHMRHASNTVRELFVGGALEDVSAKAQVAYALQLIDKDAYDAILPICAIRNILAHDLRVSSFDNPPRKMAEALATLRLLERHTHWPSLSDDGDSPLAIRAPRNDREKFLVNLRICLMLLMRQYRRLKAGTHVVHLNV